MAQKIYVISGYSGAGKDTVASILKEKHERSSILKFAAPGKRALEKIYSLPFGALDDREYRLRTAPHSNGRTFLEVLVDFWRHRDLLLGADFFPAQVEAEADYCLKGSIPWVVMFTDMRHSNEADVITSLLTKYPDTELVPVWVYRGSAKMLESDRDSYQIMGDLAKRHNSPIRFIDNMFGIDFLKKEVEKKL